MVDRSLEIKECLEEVGGGDGDRKTGDEWFGKTILATGLVYLLLSSSWQQTKQLHMKGHG